MLRPRRARKEPLRTRGDRGYVPLCGKNSFRMSTFWSLRIRLQHFLVLVIETSIILPFRWMCDRFAPRSIREPTSDLFSSSVEDDPISTGDRRKTSTKSHRSIRKRRTYLRHGITSCRQNKQTINPAAATGLAQELSTPPSALVLHPSICVEQHAPKMTSWIMDVWIMDAWSTAIMFCPYIPQRLLKHMQQSHIFGKPRMIPAERIAAFGSSSTGRGRLVIMDSGATSHFVGDPSMLQDIRYFPNDQRPLVALADGFCLTILGIGSLLFNGPSECGSYTRSYSVPNVRYVWGLAMNVISVPQLDVKHGLCSAFHSKKCEVMKAGGTVIGEAALINGLYEVVYLHVPREPQV